MSLTVAYSSPYHCHRACRLASR